MAIVTENSNERFIKYLENEKKQTIRVLFKIERQLATARLAIRKKVN